MKKILVTGAGGYIGSVLVPKLIYKNYDVIAVDRFFFGVEKLTQNKSLQIIQDDCRKLTKKYFKEVDAVIDLVAISNDPSAELFKQPTIEINAESRIKTATLAKENGVKQYILPSSASIYGYHNELLDETCPTNPLTVYAKANEQAEQGVLPLADNKFTVTVVRQATVYGLSPRMRFDLAVNGMTYGCFKNKKLPLMRDGSQYRPMLHVQDTTDLFCQLLETDSSLINGEIFNVGSEKHNFQIKDLAEEIVCIVSEFLNEKIEIEWYGDPDIRSYRLNFDKIETKLGWKVKHNLKDGVLEILQALQSGKLVKDDPTITLEWYKQLVEWHKRIKEIEKYGGILDIE